MKTLLRCAAAHVHCRRRWPKTHLLRHCSELLALRSSPLHFSQNHSHSIRHRTMEARPGLAELLVKSYHGGCKDATAPSRALQDPGGKVEDLLGSVVIRGRSGMVACSSFEGRT